MIRAVGGQGMREGGLVAMLWGFSAFTAIGKEASMSMAKGVASGKVESLVEMANEMSQFVERTAAQGGALRAVERGVFDRLLSMGRVLVDRFIALQGNGDPREDSAPDDVRPEPCHKRVIARFGQMFAEIDQRQPISGMIVALSAKPGRL